jgi:hypothetical protein
MTLINFYRQITVVTIIVLLISCSKGNKLEQDINTSGKLNNINYSIKNGILVFGTLKDYKTLLESSDIVKGAFVNEMNTTSSYESFSEKASEKNLGNLNRTDSSIVDPRHSILLDVAEDNPVFGALINSDNTVQIEDVIYFLDINNSKVFTLRKINLSKLNYIALLAGDRTNRSIGEFPMDEDVLEYVAMGYYSMDQVPTDFNTSRCRRDGIDCESNAYNGPCNSSDGFSGNQSNFNFQDENFINNQPFSVFTIRNHLDWRVRYLKLGIYFELKAKAQYEQNCAITGGCNHQNGSRSWTMSYELKYQTRKCGTSEVARNGIETPYGYIQNKAVHTAYSNITGLHKIDFKIKCVVKTKWAYKLTPNGYPSWRPSEAAPAATPFNWTFMDVYGVEWKGIKIRY